MGALVPPDFAHVVDELRRAHGLTMLERRRTPFDVLIATILSQRTRDETTERVFRALKERWPDARSLASAEVAEVDQVIHSIGFHHAKARAVVEVSRALLDHHGGEVPRSTEELLELPMVGRKTAGCVLVYAFREPAIPVDTHVHRISNRLGWVSTRTPDATERTLMELLPQELWLDLNRLMVRHGKRICLPQRPRCAECPIVSECARVGVT